MGAVYPGISPMTGHDFGFGSLFVVFLVGALIWTLAWKGIALWHAARNGQIAWIVAMLLVNTLGILEIIYFLFFRKDKNEKVKEELLASGVIAGNE